DLEYAFQVLFERYNIKRVLVEGGGYLIGSLFKQGLVDKLIVTVSPVLIGLNKTPLINIWLEDIIKLDLEEAYIDHITGELTLVYKPRQK
ncbi:MAG: dihydrofolate reductase family protein, partial [Staphylothermus sp.]|nr:dihydrofolate reductase family protein [Staphylothermus sp.]